jgi:hypothetical protein
MRRRPPLQQSDVQILTPTLQVAGRLEFFGPPLVYLNDPERDGVTVQDARVAALTPTGPFKGLMRSLVTIRRQEIVLLYFLDPAVKEKISLLVHSEHLVSYTRLAIVRGAFHMPVEALLEDFLATTAGDLLAISDAQVYFLISPPMPFLDRCDLLMVGRGHIQMYHPL